MKFRFKIQSFQTEAVDAVCRVFDGQPNQSLAKYRRDIGTIHLSVQGDLGGDFTMQDTTRFNDTGYRNDELTLTDDDLFRNIKRVQSQENLHASDMLSRALGRCQLDVEMETGTGKTYVYIKTMFELNKRYGWSKFIVVVPSIAIREGVKKSFEMTQDHFYEQYGKKARFFIYSSKNLNALDSFSSDASINVMIINTQAFAASLNEEKNVAGRKGNEAARIIYTERDDFQSRRPIDVIAANRPILILDEPQKMGGKVTQKALQQFNPLFALYYSATHKEKHNAVYMLDALDAYNERLVKRIEVKGFDLQNITGTNSYLYVSDILVDPKQPPRVCLEFEVRQKNGVVRKTRICAYDDSLYELSGNLKEYEHFRISDIDPLHGTVSFTNGISLHVGEASGNVTEAYLRRIQIRETIRSHLEKEERLFDRGIKTLSLFFIDKVEHYRTYDAEGNPQPGEFAKIFEEEYLAQLNEKLSLWADTPYQRYLREVSKDLSRVHDGYFSIDKKGHMVDSKEKRGEGGSDDVSAYDKILRNKEQLLSFSEPLRFIFSHSALREGWDNPNIFQICTLKHGGKDKKGEETTKRQEVGRGLRLSVNQDGVRQDWDALGDAVQDINLLTVIASEGYTTFVDALQKDLSEVLYKRPEKATESYFMGKSVKNAAGDYVQLDEKEARSIYQYLLKKDYIDDDARLTDTYKEAAANDQLAPLPDFLAPLAPGIHALIQRIYDSSIPADMVSDARDTKIRKNPLNDNFKKKEFQELWKEINHKYAYTVHFDSKELIQKASDAINRELHVGELKYVVTRGSQNFYVSEDEVQSKESFGKDIHTRTETLTPMTRGHIEYDLLGDIARGATITRRSAAEILSHLLPDKMKMFCLNPEDFIQKVVRIILEQKSTLIVEHISYEPTSETYDSSIFTENQSQNYAKAYEAKKHILDYVFYDGTAKVPVEKKFAMDMDAADEVSVYAKLPKGFAIPTPVGNYSPDWAIAFKKGTVRHIFFIAETKGSMSSMELRPIEKAKIQCAEKLFNHISTNEVRYHRVTSYQQLLDIIRTIK